MKCSWIMKCSDKHLVSICTDYPWEFFSSLILPSTCLKAEESARVILEIVDTRRCLWLQKLKCHNNRVANKNVPKNIPGGPQGWVPKLCFLWGIWKGVTWPTAFSDLDEIGWTTQSNYLKLRPFQKLEEAILFGKLERGIGQKVSD